MAGTLGIFYRFLRGGVAAVVKIADRDALNAGNVERGLEMFASANAGADGGEANGVAGGDGARPGREHVRLQDVFGDGGGGNGAAAEVDELTTSQGILSHEIPSSLVLLEISAGGEIASAEMMRRNYCTGEGELVKRFSTVLLGFIGI